MKRNLFLLGVALCAAVLVSCKSDAKKAEGEKTEAGATDTLVAEVEKPAEVVTLDLKFVDLQGKVKSCIVNMGTFTKYEFDEAGTLLKISDDSNEPYKITRDKKGRIIKTVCSVPYAEGMIEYSVTYAYNDEDYVVSEKPDGIDHPMFLKHKYENGRKVSTETYDGWTNNLMSTDKYNDVEVDEHGNWTKREYGNETHTREIEYY